MKVAKLKPKKEKKEEREEIRLTELTIDPTEFEEQEEESDEFFDQPGYEYRVFRVFPNDGFIGTVPSPSGFQVIQDAFGGGQYQLLRIRLSDRKLAGKRTIKIAGPPKAIEIDKGNGNALEELKRENEHLKSQISGKSSGSLLDNPKIQELLVLRAIGSNSDKGNNELLLKLVSESGDKNFKAFLEGMEMGQSFSGNAPPPENESLTDKLLSGLVSLLERKGLEIKTVNRTPQVTTGTEVRVTPTQGMEASEQMLFQKLLLEKLETFILDGIEQNTPIADMVNQLKPYAAYPSFKSLLGAITVDEILLYLKAEYSEDADAMRHLEKPETQTYLTQILEELKK